MHHFITLALATAALAAPEADPTLVRAFHAGSGIAHPISSINNVPVIDTRSPYTAGIHAFSPYAAYTGLPTTYATGLPTTYATGYPYVHSYGKREAEAEAEADPQMIYSGLPYTGLHTAYTGLPTTYATAYPTVQAVPAVNAVHAVAPAVSSVYSHIPATYSTIPATYSTIPATYSTIPATYSTIPTTYSTSPLIKALYKPAVVAPTHTLTSYNSPTQYSAVSNGAFGPKYIAKSGPVEHIVKREAEAEAEAQMVYTGLPYTGLHTAYTGLPTTYTTGYPMVQTVPAVQAVHSVAPVVSSVYSHHVPATYAVASPLAHNGNHGVVNTVYGATHSSHVGICLNNVGEQVAC